MEWARALLRPFWIPSGTLASLGSYVTTDQLTELCTPTPTPGTKCVWLPSGLASFWDGLMESARLSQSGDTGASISAARRSARILNAALTTSPIACGTKRLCSVTPAGEEEVFDLEVRGTHAYFANGTVAHNCHHAEAETYQLLDLLSANTTVWMGVTATPFRGSAESTIKFRKAWGTPHVILTMKEAVERTPPVISFPTFRTVGLLDDEEISLRSGEFVESEAGEALSQFERLDKLADLIRGYHTFRCREGGTGAAVCPKFDRPTMVAMPTVLSAKALVAKLGEYASLVIGETSDPERDYAFRSCEGMVSVLVTVAVVGEGVDLPWLRRLIDARPTMSPVAFQQLVGRVMRPVGPSEAPPEVVSVCRNIYRHGYLFDGLLPKETVKQSVEAFDKPPSRHGGRWLGLESMGRLKKHEIPLADGLVGCYYCLESAEAHRKTEWVVLTTPARQQPLVFSREVEIKQNELGLREFVYGSARWKPDTMPDEWTGFSTGLKVGQEASPKQMEWWKRDAAKIGFDPEHKPTRRDFQVFVATLQANGRL